MCHPKLYPCVLPLPLPVFYPSLFHPPTHKACTDRLPLKLHSSTGYTIALPMFYFLTSPEALTGCGLCWGIWPLARRILPCSPHTVVKPPVLVIYNAHWVALWIPLTIYPLCVLEFPNHTLVSILWPERGPQITVILTTSFAAKSNISTLCLPQVC